MGRLKTKQNDATDQKLSKEKKNKKKKIYENKFRVGSASQGHGFAIVKKRKFLSKFRRKQKKHKENEEKEFIHIKPLAEDAVHQHNNVSSSVSSSDIRVSNVSTNNLSTLSRKSKKRNSAHMQKIEIDYQAIQKERDAKAEELKVERAEHEKKVRKNIEKRKKITRKLSKKTKRGQPVMADRLELILSKLKNS